MESHSRQILMEENTRGLGIYPTSRGPGEPELDGSGRWERSPPQSGAALPWASVLAASSRLSSQGQHLGGCEMKACV